MSGRNEVRMVLQQIAEVTGGQAFSPTSVRELDAVYQKVLTQIPRSSHALAHVEQETEVSFGARLVHADRPDIEVPERRLL